MIPFTVFPLRSKADGPRRARPRTLAPRPFLVFVMYSNVIKDVVKYVKWSGRRKSEDTIPRRKSLGPSYKGTSFIRNRHPTYAHHRALGIGLL